MERHYQNSTADSAMTEIALALAMGFFSIMVLTMVSMGAGKLEAAAPAVTAALQTPSVATQTQAITNGTKEDQLVIFYQGQYFDKDIQLITLNNLNLSARIILAFPPDLEMKAAIDARAQFNTDNLIISTLNEEWMTTLRRKLK